MHENELTLPFCGACYVPLEMRGDAAERRWECPDCGERLGCPGSVRGPA